MTDDAGMADYLAGETAGAELEQEERVTLDRIRTQLAAEVVWDEPAADGQFRLLAAVATEAAEHVEPAEERSLPPAPSSTAGPVIVVAPADAEKSEESTNLVELFDQRRDRRKRRKWFGSGMLVAAAALAVGFFGVQQLRDEPASDDGVDEFEIAATVDLTATDLDPDAIATLDVKPTVAGVEFELRLMGLDNSEGDDYYAAWLMGDGEAIPLGSFHWRAGGVPIVLWSGIDDSAYNRFMVTRQVAGDGGVRSDQVVLAGDVPVLTFDG